MALIKKTLFAENLDRYNTFVRDTNPTSRYFNITELPDTFTGGKNAFLIAGSGELVPDTLIKIEIKDAAGNVSTPALAVTQSTSAPASYSLVLGPLKNNAGGLLANETGATVYVTTVAGNSSVVTKTGVTSNASGIMTISDAAFASATQYRVLIVLSSGAEGLSKVTSS